MQGLRWSPQLAALALAIGILAPQAGAAPAQNEGSAVQVSGASPLAGCLGDQADSGINTPNSEVEPWVSVNRTDGPDGDGVFGDNLIGAWQQDRWDNGGSRGIVTATSNDGGATWTTNPNTKSSICTGGTVANGGNYERSSDPWVDFSPNGDAYLMTLSVDSNPGGFGTSPNAMLVMKSTNGGTTWGNPVTLKRDENPNVLNDKNTLTADPNDSNFVYAVWDRLVSPPGETPQPEAFENAVGFRGPVWFSRTTNGGASWEPARQIFDPGTINQTIGNQIVGLPDNAQFGGALVDVFSLIQNVANRPPRRGLSIGLIRSEDRGATWSKKAITVDRLASLPVIDPDDPSTNTRRVRTGDLIPQVTVDPNSGAIYVVWQDARFGPRSSIAFSQSLDGGLSWSPTIKINKTPTDIRLGDQQAFNPVASVLDDGTIGVRYSDFRNNTSDLATLQTDEFTVHCHPTTPTACTDPANWGDEVRQTDTSYNLRMAPFARGWFIGDYVGLGTDGQDFLPFWTQPFGGDPANTFVRRVGLVPTP
ncbi:MAG TPA: sialidase family protein [Thermoleophilaceae bacterium]|nr:sialidase family protein [Thermoleophilaceae bacterium]